MTDKLKAVLSKLSDKKAKKSDGKVEKTETPIEEKTVNGEEDLAADPIEEEEDDDDEEEEDEEGDEDEDPSTPLNEPETETSTEPDQMSEEELERLKAIDQEIARLRDHGVFNAEVLFQVIKINENLDRIATVLEKLID